MTEKEIRLEIIKILARQADEPQNTVDELMKIFKNNYLFKQKI